MTDVKRTGRVVGLMLLLQLIALMVGFILLDAIRMTDYLPSAAGNAVRIKAGVIVLMANGLLTIGISIVAWPVLRRYSQPMAIWVIVLAIVMLLLQVVDNVYIMSMLSLSHQYAESGPSDIYNALGASVRTTRRYAHYFELMSIDLWLVTFYAVLLRYGLTSRIIAVLGLAVVLLQFVAVPVSGFLGYAISPNLAVPMSVGLLANSVWLLWKGFCPQESGEQ